MLVLIFIIIAYLFGSIPTGYLLVKRKKGLDIRNIGSGATGGTNVSRILGIQWGFLVGVFDALKGFLPVFLASKVLPFDWEIALVAIAPVVGHIFPCFLQFKGGKGVATMVGCLSALFGWPFFWIVLFYGIFYLAVFRISSLFSLSFSSFLPIISYFFAPQTPFLFLGFSLFFLIWWAHRENIERIKTGQESLKKVDLSSLWHKLKKIEKK